MSAPAPSTLMDDPRGPTPGDLAELLGAFNDVTARLHRTHEALQREVAALKTELRDANEQLGRSRRLAALGEMAAGIAHEVRNPLSSIRLYARMLEQDLSDRPAQRAVAGKIAVAVVGLDAVVNDVLSFARELRVSPVPTDTSVLLTRAIDACRGEVAAAACPPRIIRADAERAGGLSVYCDPAAAHTALVNVIRNAIQAAQEAPAPPGGPAVTVDAFPRGAGPDGGVVIAVADTGPGVGPDVIDRMFNPFFTTRAAGTGLGLPIVHRIVDAHAGRVTARNRPAPERGAVFELFFPEPGDPSVARPNRFPPSADTPGTDAGRSSHPEAKA